MKYLNHNLLSRLGNLPLEARHSMTGNVSGRHRSASRGSSVEFAGNTANTWPETIRAV